MVEEMPVYPGGDKALMEFIFTNVRYPQPAKDKGIQGRVIIRFCVTDIGNVENIQVIRGVDKSLDDESVRVVGMLKGWTPGKQGGKPVSVWYSIPITFSLTGSLDPFSRPRFNIYGTDTVYFNLKEMPQFPGGPDELKRFRAENLKLPVELLNSGFEGNVWVNFVVAKDGKLSDFTISGGVSPAIDAEALRVAKLMPSWKPGIENGKPVIVKTGTIFNFYPPSSDPTIPREVFVVVEEMPRFPGGDSTLIKFIYEQYCLSERGKR